MRTLRNKAFTLVEILIVVVILGILAAIVVPQFASATKDAQAGNLKAQIKEIQNQIELAKARSTNGLYPDLKAANAAGTITDWGAFIDGGYIRALPKNPFNGLSTVDAVTGGDVPTAGTGDWAGTANFGWKYNSDTGDFTACYFDEVNGLITPLVP